MSIRTPLQPDRDLDPAAGVDRSVEGQPSVHAPATPPLAQAHQPVRMPGSPARPGRALAGLPTSVLATAAGAWSAASPLLVALAVGVAGWFISDSGIHGAPRSGMRMGALAWLMAHGSGVAVHGTTVTVIPLGLTGICVWVGWRISHRLGTLLYAHGPDADRLADGERDWTVPSASLFFGLGYAVVAVLTWSLAAGSDAAPSGARVLVAVGVLTTLIAFPAIAVGSGRAAVWVDRVPVSVRQTCLGGLAILKWFAATAAFVYLFSLAWHFADAATMMSRLHTSPGESVLFGLINAGFLPNAVLAAGSWLLGPGFTVGTGTLVSPSLVVLGPLPLLPLLAALPATAANTWLLVTLALPPVVAGLAVARTQLRYPTARWDVALLRGCGSGMLAGAAFAVLAALCGGAAGPGRMSSVGPVLPAVGLHALVAFSIGGIVASALTTWWLRRSANSADEES